MRSSGCSQHAHHCCCSRNARNIAGPNYVQKDRRMCEGWRESGEEIRKNTDMAHVCLINQTRRPEKQLLKYRLEQGAAPTFSAMVEGSKNDPALTPDYGAWREAVILPAPFHGPGCRQQCVNDKLIPGIKPSKPPILWLPERWRAR